MPPNCPEWIAWSSVVTSTTQSQTPRSVVVNAGTPTSQFPESVITYASARSSSVCAAMIALRLGEPNSSSPSTKTVTPTGKVAVERAESSEMDADAALVVGRATPVQAVALPRGLEARRLPDRGVADGLHVVVRVQADPRRARAAPRSGRSPPGVHPRTTICTSGQPSSIRWFATALRRRVDVREVLGLRAHGRDRDERDDIVESAEGSGRQRLREGRSWSQPIVGSSGRICLATAPRRYVQALLGVCWRIRPGARRSLFARARCTTATT